HSKARRVVTESGGAGACQQRDAEENENPALRGRGRGVRRQRLLNRSPRRGRHAVEPGHAQGLAQIGYTAGADRERDRSPVAKAMCALVTTSLELARKRLRRTPRVRR